MSDEQDEKTTTTIGEDWNWEQIQEVWERLSSLHDHFKRKGLDLPWTARGSLFAAMQTFLLECQGDLMRAKAVMVDLLNVCSEYVADQVLAAMQSAWANQELEGQELTPKERAVLKNNIDTLSEATEMSKMKPLSEEQIQAILQAQDHIATAMNESHEQFGPEATIRALVVILAQSELFANEGDVLGAKVSVLNLLHQLWPMALHNVQKLLQSTADQLRGGPPETRPN